MGNLILQDVLLIFLVSIPLVLVLHAFRLPALIGFILTGAVFGPFGLGLIDDANRTEILAELGVTLLLFSVGLEFSLGSFAKMKTFVVKGGIVQILGSAAAATGLVSLLGWPLYEALYFGFAVSLSSTAVVLSSLLHHRYHQSVQGRVATGILILQDIAVIPMIVFLPALSGFRNGPLWTDLVASSGALVGLIFLTYLCLRYFARYLLRLVSHSRSRELFLISVMGIALGFSWMTNALGLSFALGAFLGGLVVGNTDFRDEALSEITPFRYCFSSLFFVSIGMLMDFDFIRDHWQTVLLLLFLVPILKVFITSGILLLLQAPLRVAVNIAIILGQVGEFSFLLATLGKTSGAITTEIYQYIIAVASVSMLLTPLFVRLALPLAEFLARLPGFHYLARRSIEHVLEGKAKQMKDHVIICGFGPLGRALGHLLEKYRIPFLILELNPETIEKSKEKHPNIYFGDGASAEILYKSGIERARLLAITIPDFLNNIASIRQALRINPKIKIITRAKMRHEVASLYQAGADVVISEDLEGGIEMGRVALGALGIPRLDVDEYVNKIREFGSADFF